MTISDLIEQGGSRADNVPAFVIELIKSLEDRVAALESAKEAPASAPAASAPAATVAAVQQPAETTQPHL